MSFEVARVSEFCSGHCNPDYRLPEMLGLANSVNTPQGQQLQKKTGMHGYDSCRSPSFIFERCFNSDQGGDMPSPVSTHALDGITKSDVRPFYPRPNALSISIRALL